jgi:GWxTD domain-containing protein
LALGAAAIGGTEEDPLLAEVAEVTRAWPDGPVRYLMSRDEQKAYKRLDTVEEQLRFVGTFWARRDPSSATARNELREQFESRVRYANANYRERGIEGWRTHRGQIFIMFGPPDQTEQRIFDAGPQGARRAHIWRYHRRVFQTIAPNAALVFYDLYNDAHFYLLPPLYWGQTYFERYLGFQERPSLTALPTSYERELERLRKELVIAPEAAAPALADQESITLNHVPFRWSFELVPFADRAELKLKIELRFRDLSFTEVKNAYHTLLEFRCRLLGPDGRPYDERRHTVDLTLPNQELEQKAENDALYSFEEVLAGPPGQARLELLLSDRSVGQANVNLQRAIVELPSLDQTAKKP